MRYLLDTDWVIEDRIFTILEPPKKCPVPTIPSLLGRDMLIAFGLFMHERSGRVFLMEQDEVDALGFHFPLGE